ncbi:MAG: hypothetical protein JNJ46_02200 [Myxococcales bacterium]|nr:hypothetical protein [Myxococcales bacterium]
MPSKKPPTRNTKESKTVAKPASAALSPAAAYSRFLPEAMKLPLSQVVAARLDPQLAFGNVQAAVAAIRPELARIGRELPAVNTHDLESLPDLAAALLHACERAAIKPVKAEALAQKLAALHALREPMLLVAEGLALLGMLPKERVAQIRAGSGPFDAAQDGVALAELYRAHASALRGKQPFSDAQLTQIETQGQELMQLVTPSGARPAMTAGQTEAIEVRDRLAALLEERYGMLRRVAVYLWGDAAADKVPMLRSRLRAGKASQDPVPAPTPVPTPLAPPAEPGKKEG